MKTPNTTTEPSACFQLDAEAVEWVETTLRTMTVEQKASQLFCTYLFTDDPIAWQKQLREHGIEPGAVLLMPREPNEARTAVAALQTGSSIPLLVAANLESGSVNFLVGSEAFATPMSVAATGDSMHADHLAIHCANIAADIGINWAFAPVVDVAINPANPITNTRAFSSDTRLVAEFGAAYVRALEVRGVMTSPKHFPGDGHDDRDQHLVTTNNDLDADDWRRVYAPAFRSVIDAGARSMMIGHIRQPALTRERRPGIDAREIMPATLAPELIGDILRDELGFTGLVVSDSSSMAGLTSVMARRDALSRIIEAGCDMILGNVDVLEDFQIVVAAIKTGRISAVRLNDAVQRILSAKASLGLHRKAAPPRTKYDEPANWRKDLAEASITLVKDTQSLLPLSPKRHRRALVHVIGDKPTLYDPSGPFHGRFVEKLRERGLDVTVQLVSDTSRTTTNASQLHHQFDVCIYFANVKFEGNTNTVRVKWTPPQGPDAPRHVATLPTALVSIADPYLLQDMPMVRTAINGYTPSTATVDATVKVLFGEIAAKGVSPIDPTAGHWDALI